MNSSISKSFATGNIYANVTSIDCSSGGLIGYTQTSIVSSCYAISNVVSNVTSANSSSGGLIGYTFYSTVSDCYSIGSVNSTVTLSRQTSFGGLIGYALGRTISNCYASVSVNSSYTYSSFFNSTGGLVGKSPNSTFVSNYFDTDISGFDNSKGVGNIRNATGVSGKTLMELKLQKTFIDWDFNEVWSLRKSSYPNLIWQYPTYSLSVNNGNGSGNFNENAQVIIVADLIEGYAFSHWSTVNGGSFEDSNSVSTTFTMPENNVVITANYEEKPSTHSLTVNNGTGTGGYLLNTQISISADDAPLGYAFSHWSTDNGGSFEDSNSVSTTFTMPENNVVVTANYQVLPATPLHGDGSELSPYQISNLAELRWVSETTASWDKNFVITADINATETKFWNNGSGFSSIGNFTNKFTGSFDNQGSFIINSLTINRPNEIYVGFLGFTSLATIKNIRLDNLNLTGGLQVGGLIGNASNSSITSCYTEGVIYSFLPYTSSESSSGGLIGSSSISVVSNSYSSVTVNSSFSYLSSLYYHSNSGGLIGRTFWGEVSDCYASGNVNTNSTSSISSGGLIGDSRSTLVSNSYSIGEINAISSTSSTIGKFIGEATDSTFTGNFYEINGDETLTIQGVGNITNSSGVLGKTSEEMKQLNTFNDWDFKEIWSIRKDSYPTLKWEFPTYELIVYKGDNSGFYNENSQVYIVAHSAGLGYEFSHWTSSDGGTFENARSSSTTFIMPGNETIVTAHYYNNLIDSFVKRFYQFALNRDYDPNGLFDWRTKLSDRSLAAADIARGFIHSQEFKNRNLSDEDFLDVLYRAFFNREVDPAGKSHWLSLLSSGHSREYIVEEFIKSAEFKNLADTYGILVKHPIEEFVIRFYQQCLNRDPDLAGLSDWVSQLKAQTRGGADIAIGFIFSPEFLSKNVSNEEYLIILYKAFFGRNPDSVGFNDWLDQLNNGATRLFVLDGFLDAVEFSNLCKEYGILTRLPAAAEAELFSSHYKYSSENLDIVLSESVTFNERLEMASERDIRRDPLNFDYNNDLDYLIRHELPTTKYIADIILTDGARLIIYLEEFSGETDFLEPNILRMYYEEFTDGWLETFKLDLEELGYKLDSLTILEDSTVVMFETL